MPYSDPTVQRLRSALAAAKQRCYNPRDANYRWYGAKGITICAQWKKHPAAFVEWALANDYRPGLYLDRRDNAKGYSPSNCRWVSPLESTRNRSSSIFVLHAGERLPLIEWAKRFGLTHKAIYQRYTKGERAPELFRPSRRVKPHKPCRMSGQ